MHSAAKTVLTATGNNSSKGVMASPLSTRPIKVICANAGTAKCHGKTLYQHHWLPAIDLAIGGFWLPAATDCRRSYRTAARRKVRAT